MVNLLLLWWISSNALMLKPLNKLLKLLNKTLKALMFKPLNKLLNAQTFKLLNKLLRALNKTLKALMKLQPEGGRGKRRREKGNYSISEEHEDNMLERLRENECLVEKGPQIASEHFEAGSLNWRDKAKSLGYTAEVLLG
jgi:hypothetical protein